MTVLDYLWKWKSDMNRLAIPLRHVCLHPLDALHLMDDVQGRPPHEVDLSGEPPDDLHGYIATVEGVRIYQDSHYGRLPIPEATP